MLKNNSKSQVFFGPAGLGGVKDAEQNLQKYAHLGLSACEIAFTHGIYIKKKEDALKIRNYAKKLGIRLSIHAPYWINLNSEDPNKIKKSEQRIMDCCKVGTWLGAHRVVFHPGYYGKNKEKAYEVIKKKILGLKEKIKIEGYTTKLAPEIMGKVNVFGSIEEIKNLFNETGCSFCIDFAHILARYKDYMFRETFKIFEDSKEIHIHFSGIEYGEKGEKKHKETSIDDWEKLLQDLPQDKNIIIINESTSPLEDSIKGLELYEKIKEKSN